MPQGREEPLTVTDCTSRAPRLGRCGQSRRRIEESVMSTEDNKALVRRFFEDVWNKHNLALVDELFSADYVDHDDFPPGIPPTRDGFKRPLVLCCRYYSVL